jgi:hypothetical protein
MEGEVVTRRGERLLKLSFLIGIIADTIVAANWFLIAAGMELPNSLSGMVGRGEDYRFAMYISGIFMAGWAVILAWGRLKPFERKGLLLITAGLIFFSVVLDVVFYGQLLGGPGFALGVTMRTGLIILFSISLFYSRGGIGRSGLPAEG